MRTRDSAQQCCGSRYDMIDETYLTAEGLGSPSTRGREEERAALKRTTRVRKRGGKNREEYRGQHMRHDHTCR